MFMSPRAFALLVLLAPFTSAHAGPGNFDTSFNGNGRAAVKFDLPNGTLDDRAIAVIPGATTTMVIGTVRPAQANGQQRVGFTRLLASGGIDTSFGTQGKVTQDTVLATVVGAGMDNAGRLYIVGTYVDSQNGDSEFGVQRYLADGSPDLGYGFFGLAVAAFDQGSTNNDVPRAIAVSPGGEAYVAGSVQFSTAADTDFGVARFDNTGVLATAFSGDGKATFSFDVDGLGADEAYAITNYDPNTMRAVGTARRGDGSRVVAVVSFLSGSGALVPAFCSGTTCQGTQLSLIPGPGKRTFKFDMVQGPTSDTVMSAALSSDTSGRLGIAGMSTLTSGTPNVRGAFALLTATGLLPNNVQRGGAPTGNTSNFGRVVFPLANPTITTGVVHRNVDDHWVLSGTYGTTPAQYGYAFYIDSTPAADTSFTLIDAGGGPITPAAFQPIAMARANGSVPLEVIMTGVAIDPAQRIVLGGFRLWTRASGIEDNDFAIARLAEAASSNNVFANGFE